MMGSKPLPGSDRSFQSPWKLQLSTALIKVRNVYPSITWQSGEEGGCTYFTYDKLIIVSALVQCLGPSKGKRSVKKPSAPVPGVFPTT